MSQLGKLTRGGITFLVLLQALLLSSLPAQDSTLQRVHNQIEFDTNPLRVAGNELHSGLALTESFKSKHDFAYVGNGSCSYCHNNHDDSQLSPVGREYSVWIDNDPHADAYTTLLSSKSKSIAAKLGIGNAHQAKVCLDCHSTAASTDAKFGKRLSPNHRHSVVDGVGCESCHGPAEQWLGPHTQSGWEQLGRLDKEKFGFNDTSDLVTRGKTCAECHIGSSDKDMNHDLIASGHPRLLFELSAYQAMMPRHWSRAEDKQNNSAALEAKLWAVGQATSMIKTVDLMEKRALEQNAPWPEFAEYGCFECHQQLRGGETGSLEQFNDGKLNWATFHRPSFERMINSSSVGQLHHTSLLNQLNQLKTEMGKPLPDRNRVISLSGDLRKELNTFARQLDNHHWTQADLDQQVRSLTSVQPTAIDANWDGLTQRYLGAVAIRQAIIETNAIPANHFDTMWRTASRQKLKNVRDMLYFESGYGSPKNFNLKKKTELANSFSELYRLLRIDASTDVTNIRQTEETTSYVRE